MLINFKVKNADHQEEEKVVNLPGCCHVDDVFQIGTCLYKITSLDRKKKNGKAIFARTVKQNSFRSRR